MKSGFRLRQAALQYSWNLRWSLLSETSTV